MRRLVLVRHSKPEIEPDKPASEWRLDDAGRHRSKLLAGTLCGFNADVVWSSKEPKAVETAEIVADALGVPVRTTDGLEEHHRIGVPYFPSRNELESAVEQFLARQVGGGFDGSDPMTQSELADFDAGAARAREQNIEGLEAPTVCPQTRPKDEAVHS